MRSLEQLDSWITAKVRAWSGKLTRTSQAPELLEIRRDILNQIRDQIQWTGESRRRFPFNTVRISILTTDPDRQMLLDGTLGDTQEWQDTVSSLLREAECSVPSGLQVSVSVEQRPDSTTLDRPYHIDFANQKRTGAEENASKERPKVLLLVLQGEAELSEYKLDSDRINIGRLREVISDKDGLRRRNHIAFAETETTVSREHAFIQYDQESGRFRVHDCMSQRGTRVFREGRRFDVPGGPRRGFQLRPGDEIHLGDARLAFATVESTQEIQLPEVL